MTGGSSIACRPGDVVLVPFPFRDGLAERARPPVVVSSDAYNVRGDVIVAAVTSHSPRDEFDHALSDWVAAGLRLPSTVRMLLATVAADRILHQTGRLNNDHWSLVQNRIGKAISIV
ncbi:MAG: type II toxin-antitoxin system PemK/MazF family toxin [Planctomycetaceae bacterium]